MQDKPPFDIVRAAFLLVAFVVGVYAVVTMGFSAACIWHAKTVLAGGTECNPHELLMEMLDAALAAALAFAGFNRSK